MGMGEPADNADSVVEAAKIMVDVNMFSLAPRRVTISTVAPNPDVFLTLSKAPVVLAWSVHSSRDKIRRQLVPTTKHTMVELRNGLMEALKGRSKRLRNTMLEIALLDGINDSPEDAEHLAEFCRPFSEGPDAVKGIKLTVNLIPWNDISASSGPASTYRQPKMERVLEYQKILVENGILCFVRTTRGDEENAACGMLSTAKRKIKAVTTGDIL
jgi:23S rRNA (adenine2503-C2)-methyltransferase